MESSIGYKAAIVGRTVCWVGKGSGQVQMLSQALPQSPLSGRAKKDLRWLGLPLVRTLGRFMHPRMAASSSFDRPTMLTPIVPNGLEAKTQVYCTGERD